MFKKVIFISVLIQALLFSAQAWDDQMNQFQFLTATSNSFASDAWLGPYHHVQFAYHTSELTRIPPFKSKMQVRRFIGDGKFEDSLLSCSGFSDDQEKEPIISCTDYRAKNHWPREKCSAPGEKHPAGEKCIQYFVVTISSVGSTYSAEMWVYERQTVPNHGAGYDVQLSRGPIGFGPIEFSNTIPF